MNLIHDLQTIHKQMTRGNKFDLLIFLLVKTVTKQNMRMRLWRELYEAKLHVCDVNHMKQKINDTEREKETELWGSGDEVIIAKWWWWCPRSVMTYLIWLWVLWEYIVCLTCLLYHSECVFYSRNYLALRNLQKTKEKERGSRQARNSMLWQVRQQWSERQEWLDLNCKSFGTTEFKVQILADWFTLLQSPNFCT